MQDSLLNLADNLSVINNKVSEIDNKILQAALIEKFSNTYQLCNNDLNNDLDLCFIFKKRRLSIRTYG